MEVGQKWMEVSSEVDESGTEVDESEVKSGWKFDRRGSK